MAVTDLLAHDDPLLPEEAGQADTILPGDNLLLDWIRRELKNSHSHLSKFREEHSRARRFFDGKQLTKEDQEILKQEGRPDNAFNSAQKFVRFITGVERVTPEALIFNAIDESDQVQQAYGEQMTRRYDWAIAQGSGVYERSTAFQDLIIGGIGAEDYSIDYGEDERGLPAMSRFSPLELWFPNSNRENLADARWRARETWIDKDEVLSRWPDKKIIINSALATSSDRSYPQPGKENYKIDYVETYPMTDAESGESEKNKLRIMQFEWFDNTPGYYFFDPLEQNDTWMSDGDFFRYRRKLQSFTGDKVTDYVRRVSRQYKRVFLLNRSHLLSKPLKLKRFHINVMTGSYDEEDRIWYGYFRVLIDPQRFANKFFNQLLEILGRTAKGGGFLYEKSVFTAGQAEDFKLNYAKPGTSQEVKDGAITQKKIMPKPSGELPTAAISLVQFCIEMMENVTGIAPDQYGGGSSANVPGVTLRQKGKSALILLSPEFDALSRFRVAEGYIVQDLLESLADDRLIRVGDHEEGHVEKLDSKPFDIRYSLSLDDTERDPNIRKMYEENVMAIAPTLIRMQMFLPELLDYARLPFKFKKALKEAIRRAYQARQEAAQQGIPQGGRSSPVTPQERAAKVQESQARTMVQYARADRLKTQSKRDEVRTIMDALSKSFEMMLDRDKQSTEKTQAAFEMIQSAFGNGQRPQPKARR